MSKWLKIDTKFEGRCAFCNETIPAGVEVLWDQPGKRIAHADCRAKDEREREVPPARTKLGLWTHQAAGYEFAFHRAGSMLAMDMGTGKTALTIALLDAWGARRVMIFGPRAVLPVWPAEFAKHSIQAWRVEAPTGTIDKRTETLVGLLGDPGPWAFVSNYDVVGTGLSNAVDERPDLLQRIAAAERSAAADPLNGLLLEDLATLQRSLTGQSAAWTRRESMQRLSDVLKSASFDAVILDESHRIKAPGSQQSMFLRDLADTATRVLGLSGTPMPKGPEDVYAQMRAIDPSVFGRSYRAFRSQYCVMGGYEDRQIVDYQNMDEFRAKMRGCGYRCKIDDVMDLPDAVDTTLPIPLSAKEARAHRDLEAVMVAGIEDGTVTAFNALSKLLRLQQITGGYAQMDDEESVTPIGESKRTVLRELVEDIDPAEPVVVFCRFRADLDAVRAVAAETGRPVDELSGRRNDVGAKWEPRAGAVAAVQISAGSMGIDLTASHYAIYYSLGYSLGDYLQSRARLRRAGQTRPVFYYHLLARLNEDGSGRTVDDHVMQAIGRKGEVVGGVLEALSGPGEHSFSERIGGER